MPEPATDSRTGAICAEFVANAVACGADVPGAPCISGTEPWRRRRQLGLVLALHGPFQLLDHFLGGGDHGSLLGVRGRQEVLQRSVE